MNCSHIVKWHSWDKSVYFVPLTVWKTFTQIKILVAIQVACEAVLTSLLSKYQEGEGGRKGVRERKGKGKRVGEKRSVRESEEEKGERQYRG